MAFEKGNNLGHRIQKGEKLNPQGRPRLAKNILKTLPKDAEVKVYQALFTAITMPSTAKAREYLTEQMKEGGEYGIVMEKAINELCGENGWKALNDILDRLFGKAVQKNDTKITTDEGVGVIRVVDARRSQE